VRGALTFLSAVLLVAVGGYALCALTGWSPHVPSLLQAAGTALVASGAAFVPLLLCRGAPQATVAQAALVATVIHLFVCAIGAVVMLIVQGLGVAAVCWILAFYTATLVLLVVAVSRAMRAAPIGAVRQ
jgi:hypothetical protein